MTLTTMTTAEPPLDVFVVRLLTDTASARGNDSLSISVCTEAAAKRFLTRSISTAPSSAPASSASPSPRPTQHITQRNPKQQTETVALHSPPLRHSLSARSRRLRAAAIVTADTARAVTKRIGDAVGRDSKALVHTSAGAAYRRRIEFAELKSASAAAVTSDISVASEFATVTRPNVAWSMTLRSSDTFHCQVGHLFTGLYTTQSATTKRATNIIRDATTITAAKTAPYKVSSADALGNVVRIAFSQSAQHIGGIRITGRDLFDTQNATQKQYEQDETGENATTNADGVADCAEQLVTSSAQTLTLSAAAPSASLTIHNPLDRAVSLRCIVPPSLTVSPRSSRLLADSATVITVTATDTRRSSQRLLIEIDGETALSVDVTVVGVPDAKGRQSPHDKRRRQLMADIDQRRAAALSRRRSMQAELTSKEPSLLLTTTTAHRRSVFDAVNRPLNIWYSPATERRLSEIFESAIAHAKRRRRETAVWDLNALSVLNAVEASESSEHREECRRQWRECIVAATARPANDTTRDAVLRQLLCGVADAVSINAQRIRRDFDIVDELECDVRRRRQTAEAAAFEASQLALPPHRRQRARARPPLQSLSAADRQKQMDADAEAERVLAAATEADDELRRQRAVVESQYREALCIVVASAINTALDRFARFSLPNATTDAPALAESEIVSAISAEENAIKTEAEMRAAQANATALEAVAAASSAEKSKSRKGARKS